MPERTYQIARAVPGRRDTCIDEIASNGSRTPILSLEPGTPGIVAVDVLGALQRAYGAGREDRSGELLPDAEAFLDDMNYLYRNGAAEGIELIAKERRRQIEECGYDAAHDDVAMGTSMPMKAAWSISEAEDTSAEPILDLIAAAAILAAELDRIDRMTRRVYSDGKEN